MIPALPDYNQFTVNEFVLDDFFRCWVFQPDEQTMSFWHSYLLTHAEQRGDIETASSLLLHLRSRHDDLPRASRERIWQVLHTAHDRQSWPGARRQKSWSLVDRLFGSPARSWAIAASLVGLLLLAGGGWFVWNGQPKEIHTNYGERQTVTLPDGSRVQLNGNSTLRYSRDWADQNREVWLTGEAFFVVTKRQSPTGRLKFVTHTPDLDISVLGTRFNVNTHRGNTAVTLVEGRVQLSKPDASQSRIIEMKPGQFAATQPNVEQVAVRTEKPQLHTAWVTNQFIFENTPLRDIAQQLQDTYGLDVVFEDNDLASRRFTGNLSSQSVETLLTTLTLTFQLTIERTGNTVSLRRTP